MTTPTTAEVGHGSKEPTVVEIDGFRGRLISADHADYDIARAVWNGAIDRRPRLIARCIGTADVVAAVRFARDHDLEIAIRGGGHNVAGTAVCDDGIVIDLSAMRAVRVDPADRRAWVQGGALWGDVDHETQAHGLATTGGIVSHTGVAGLTLGGGVGWLMRKHGLTVDNLLAVDVVTADGELLRASEDEHPDLFWALRGGGGNFGVVTSFEFRLHSVGPTVLAGPILWDATDAGEVLRFYRDFVRDAPDELGTVVRFGAAPPLPVIPEDLHWRPVVMVGTCYAGPIEDGEQVLRPLRAFRTPLLDLVGPTPYVGFQSALDSTVVHGWNYYWKSTHLPELRDDLIDVIAEHAFSCSSPRSYVAMFHLGGAVSRVAEGALGHSAHRPFQMEHRHVRPRRRAGERVLDDHVDEVVAELGEVGGLPVVVPTVDDGRVERALESHVRRGPDQVEERSPECAERAEHLLTVLDRPSVAGTDHHHRAPVQILGDNR